MAIVIGRREPWSGYMKKFFSFALALLTTGIVSALAQTYPTRTITIVIAFPPGGPNEGVVRFLAEKLTPSLGQAVIIENRPGGAGGTVGTRSVANAAPDGHTLLLSPPGPLVVAPLIYKNVGYDPTKAFTPITALFSIPQMLVVNPAVPVKSVQELIAYAKTNPGKISFPSPGYGTQPHLLGEMFKLMAGIDIIHIPYKGPAAAVTDLLAGQVQMYFENIGLLLPGEQPAIPVGTAVNLSGPNGHANCSMLQPLQVHRAAWRRGCRGMLTHARWCPADRPTDTRCARAPGNRAVL